MSANGIAKEAFKVAAIEYGKALCGLDLKPDPGHVFSQRYQERKAQILSKAAGSQHRRRTWISIAASFAAVLLIFAMVLAFNPAAYAAVRNWSINIYNTIADYSFAHTEDDHAYLICAPGTLPEGFVRTESYRKGFYTRNTFTNEQTGEYIRFEYRKPTESQIRRIEKRSENALLLLEDGPIRKYFTQNSSRNKLFWYDPQRNLVFNVESNLSAEVLAVVFESISFRLPMYEPTWLPEGFEVTEAIDMMLDYVIDYYNPTTDEWIYYTYTDMAETDAFAVDYLGEDITKEKIVINGCQGYFYYSNDGLDNNLIWIDENNNLVFILTTTLDREDCIRIAQSIICTETQW